MTYNTTIKKRKGERGILLVLLLFLCILAQVFADPSGAVITSSSTVYGPNVSGAMRNDSRGSITTIILNSIQQDSHWKAYVGNVTGLLSLQNPNNFTIYSWDLTTITGQVYASRYSNLSWTTVTCADPAVVGNETVFHNMTSPADTIARTFNWSIHKQFIVGTNTIVNNSCNSTVTNINNTRQAPAQSSPFQEILIKDANSYLVYLTEISDNTQGYDNTSYDFQMIVGESDIKAQPTPYYFYVELR